jgi:glycosyltransferase involved in cell wall biosynthesis
MSKRKIKLSILICSLESRSKLLNRLLSVLGPQVENEKSVEILISKDNGNIPIGTKRNNLVSNAKGDYVCFVDDDDLVSNEYVKKILKAIETKPDCCSLNGELIFNGQTVGLFFHSAEYDRWINDIKNHLYFRCPNHLNAIKKDIVLKCPFPDKNFGEDHDFSVAIQKLIKKESKIDGILYKYILRKRLPGT